MEVVLKITNVKGLHARAAASFVKVADSFRSDIEVEKSGQTVSGKSIMGLLTLAASNGTTIRVKANGTDAHDAIRSISDLVNAKFNEEV